MTLTPAQVLAMLRAEKGGEAFVAQFNALSVDDRLELVFRLNNVMSNNMTLVAERIGLSVDHATNVEQN